MVRRIQLENVVIHVTTCFVPIKNINGDMKLFSYFISFRRFTLRFNRNIVDIMRNSSQCIHDRARQFATTDPDEGCTVTGLMKVNKVSGNFHIAHGESVVRDGRHIHHFNPITAPNFNISHTIHSLRFGDSYPNMPTNPMDSGNNVPSIVFSCSFNFY